MQIDYDGYVFDHWQAISGLNVPPIRVNVANRPGQHGAIIHADKLTERPITIEGFLAGLSESDWSTERDALNGAMAPRGSDGALTVGDRILYCRPVGLDWGGYQNYIHNEYQAQFKAADPILYGATLKSTNIYLPTATGGFAFPLGFPLAFGTVSVGGLYLAANAGNIAVYPSLVRIYGPVDNPQLKNNTTGDYLKLTLSVASGDYLELNFRDRTIMLNGTASRYSYLDSASTWFQLEPGDNEIRYTANTYQAGSYCQFQFRDGYL